MSKKLINVRVTTMDAELEFSILPSTTGKLLFDQVVKTIGLREICCFGLQYTDNKGFPSWLKLNKKVLQQDVKKEPTLQFKFRAKFYPEDVDEIIQDITLRLFYLQVKELILSEEVYCPAETSVLLASYAMQVKYDDYNADLHQPGFLSNDRLLPKRVIEQYKLSIEEWEKRIMDWWADHRAVSHEKSMLEYLKIAQDLEMYGVNYFEVRNKKGTELYLGVDALGLNIYKMGDKLSPEVGFPWSEIRYIRNKSDKRFVIKPIGKKTNDFVFYAPHLRINVRILALCMGNHELYMRRRKPDTIDVQQMKLQAKEEQAHRQLEQERLSKEMSARELAEQKQREYEERIKLMEEEMNHAAMELKRAQETIRQLEDQLNELNEAKYELEVKERELHSLTEQLQSERMMSEDERSRLVSEIKVREVQVEEMREQVDAKTTETYKLQLEVQEVRSRQQDNKVFSSSLNEIEDLTNAHVDLVKDNENEILNLPQTELDRIVATDNVGIKEKLELLNKELDLVKDEQNITNYDVLHMKNKRAGRDKYKTLRQIRNGNTKRRIDQYENM